jgi:hypothetical protein
MRVNRRGLEKGSAVVTIRVCVRVAMGIIFACASVVGPAEAQMNTQEIKRTVGLKSGSQAPPGVYFIAPLLFIYKADDVKDRNGDRLPLAASLTTQAYGGGGDVVTTRRCSEPSTPFMSCFRWARTTDCREPKSMRIPERD